MKIFILLVTSLFFAVTTFSQKPSGIVGKWKAVSADDGGIFMDFKKDSISIIEELKSDYPDDASVKRKKMLFKKEYAVQFEFGSDGSFKVLQGDKIKNTGSYKIDAPQKGSIRILYKDASGKEIFEDCTYFDLSAFMLFSMKNNTVRFMLEKAK